MVIKQKQPNDTTGPLYKLDVSVNVEPENYLPYEVSYEVTFSDRSFKKRIESLAAHICFTRSLLFFDVSKVRVVEESRLDTINFDSKESLLIDKKVVYRESNERVALKLQRQLNFELRYYLDYESHLFKMLEKSKAKYTDPVRSN